jgi:CDP-paratose 2-epimerase
MNILITGGIGFIGTNCALYFSKQKNNVTLVDDFSRSGVDQNANYLKKNFPSIKIVKSSISQLYQYEKDLKKADVVIHLAAQTAVTTSIENPLLDFQTNLNYSFSPA